jgi:cell division protein FtsI (penicillin-binding protein 3)
VGLTQRRIGLLFAVFLVLLSIAVLRAGWVGLVNASTLKNAAAIQQVVDVALPAQRGSITDRTGTELAVSEPASDVSATPYLVKDPRGTAAKLAPILGVPVGDLLDKLTERSGFVYLSRKLPSGRAAKVRKLDIAGIDLTPTSRREYPRDWLASQVLGTVKSDGLGGAGLEYGEEKTLHGKDGERRIVRDALGEPISIRDTTPMKPGHDIQLTLDAQIQAKAEEVLRGVGQAYKPKSATALVTDPRTGQVLAMANWPGVNANDVAGAPPAAWQNRTVGDVYEPGSTFKIVTVAGALQERLVKPETMFSLPPKIKVADRLIGEAHDRGAISLSTAEILAQSSNVGTIMIGQRLGAKRFDKWVRRFGFGTKSGIALPGEEQGLVLPLDKYSGSSMGNLPIGQGEAVTAVQLAAAYATIANGGILRTPQVIKAIDGKKVALPKGKRIISPFTASEVRKMLEGVIRVGGTGTEAAIDGYTLAGKTGTANKIDPKTGMYSESAYVASFVGFAPANDPKLLVTVTVDEPRGGIYGGDVAAPAFQRIAQFALPYLGIPPS